MEYIHLNISASTLNAIGAALQELPYKIARPAIAEIDQQVQAHLKRKSDNERSKAGQIRDPNGDEHVHAGSDIGETGEVG